MRSLIEIIKATSVEDAEKISIIAKEIWTEHYTSIIGLNQVKYMLEKFQSVDKIYEDISLGGYTYYMAKHSESTMVGYCAIKSNKGERSIFLSKLYVKNNFRGMGISKQFLKLIIEQGKKENYDYIWLTVNKNNSSSIAVYKKMGFIIVEEIVTDIGSGFVMDDYKMQLELN